MPNIVDLPTEPWKRTYVERLIAAGVLKGEPGQDGNLYLHLDQPWPGWRVSVLLGRILDSILLITSQELAELRDRVAKSVVAVGFDPTQTIGAGVVVSQNRVVTADHVVQALGNAYPVVTTLAGASAAAQVAKRAPDLDLAVLEVPYLPGDAVPAQVGPVPPVGAQVMAVGSPMGLQHYTTLGIVSDTAIQVKYYQTAQNMFPTDAPINPGNSGGGLFSMDGKLVGFTLMKIVDPSVEAFGFAEPAEPALKSLGVI